MVELIAQTDAFDGLSAVLDQIQTFHPAPIIDAMLRRIAQGPITYKGDLRDVPRE